MSTITDDTDIESLTASQLAKFIKTDCDKDSVFKMRVLQNRGQNQRLAEDYPNYNLGKFHRKRQTGAKAVIMSRALDAVKRELNDEDQRRNLQDQRRNMGEFYPRQGATSDESTTGLTAAFANVNLNRDQGDDVSEMDLTFTSNRNRSTGFNNSNQGHRRRSNSLGTIDDDEVEGVDDDTLRDSFRVFAQNWLLVNNSNLSEGLKSLYYEWMLSEMVSKKKLSTAFFAKLAEDLETSS